MAQGKPVIATTVGAFPETVDDGVTGLLVPPGDTNALATAISRLFDDERALVRMGDAARERARILFSWERSIERWENLYARLRELPPRKPSEAADPSPRTLFPAE
jgi:type III pantothenate kinase